MVTASPNSQRHTYSYDGIGTRRSLNASGAGRFTSVYDLAGQLTSLRNPYSERTTFSYDDSGRRTVQRNANGTRVSTAYDAASQTSQVIHRPAAGSPLLQLDYRYDNAGNRKVLIEGGGTARVTWSYDAQNQLTGEHRTGTNAYRQTYTFDPAGNRTLKNLDGTRTTYGYDSANQLRYGQAVAGRTTFQYDLTGNQRIEQPPTGNRTTTTWNYENQPTQYRLPTGSPVTMAYNGDNRRISLQQGASTTKFVWDAVIDAYVKELDGSNVVQAVYTSEPQHYGAALSQRRGSTSHILHADALGTTRLLTTSAGASSDTYLYDAWGNLITSSGTTVNPFRWVGRYGYYMDQSTGLVYVRARMYVPVVARWASVDPVGFVDTQNLLVYVSNSPTSQIDATGLFEELPCVNVEPTCRLRSQGRHGEIIGPRIRQIIRRTRGVVRPCEGFEWIDVNGAWGCTDCRGHCGCWCNSDSDCMPRMEPYGVCSLVVHIRFWIPALGWSPWSKYKYDKKGGELFPNLGPLGLVEMFGDCKCYRTLANGRVSGALGTEPDELRQRMQRMFPGTVGTVGVGVYSEDACLRNIELAGQQVGG